MPALLRPGATFDIWLEGDIDVFPRPTFQAVAISAETMIQFTAILKKVVESKQASEILELAFSILDNAIVGWENMQDRQFSKAEMRKILTMPECMELVQKIMGNNSLSEDERKKSVSQR
jgi:hypothetical protein